MIHAYDSVTHLSRTARTNVLLSHTAPIMHSNVVKRNGCVPPVWDIWRHDCCYAHLLICGCRLRPTRTSGRMQVSCSICVHRLERMVSGSGKQSFCSQTVTVGYTDPMRAFFAMQHHDGNYLHDYSPTRALPPSLGPVEELVTLLCERLVPRLLGDNALVDASSLMSHVRRVGRHITCECIARLKSNAHTLTVRESVVHTPSTSIGTSLPDQYIRENEIAVRALVILLTNSHAYRLVLPCCR